mgnify:CR=1 FL=1
MAAKAVADCDGVKFAASGREDWDVRMLGNGRPAYAELQNCRTWSTQDVVGAFAREVAKASAGVVEALRVELAAALERKPNGVTKGGVLWTEAREWTLARLGANASASADLGTAVFVIKSSTRAAFSASCCASVWYSARASALALHAASTTGGLLQLGAASSACRAERRGWW